MYPVLFTIGSISVETYYVLWLLALSLAMRWSVRRFVLYGVDEDEGRRVIGWAFIGMLVGARAFEYVWNFRAYWNDLALILDLNRGGLSEVGAFLGAFITAWCLCRRNPRLSFSRLCDVVVPPAISTMIVGRWGCFFAGCCTGISSTVPWAVHFPYDPAGLTRHPTQIYYSLASGIILLILLAAEKRIFRRGQIPCRTILAPLGLMPYSLMRLLIDPLRAEAASDGLTLSHAVLLCTLPLELIWLYRSLKSWKRELPASQ